MCAVHGSGMWDVCGKVSTSQIGAVPSSQTREAAAIPGEVWEASSGSCGVEMGQPAAAWACLWSEGMKYSMKITLSLWLDSSYSYRIGEVIYFVVYPKHAYKKLLSNPKWGAAAARGRAARPLLHSLAVMVTQPEQRRLGRGCVSTGEGWGEGPSVGRALFELIAVFEGVLFPLLKPAPWQRLLAGMGAILVPGIPNPA